MEDGTRSEPAPINAFHKSPERDHRPRRHDGAARRAGDDLRGRGRDGASSSASAPRNVNAADAMDYIFGYTNFIDGSARGLPPPGNVFFQMKSRDTFAPIGPYIVTADEITDPQKLQITAVEQRHADAELQHRRHGAQDPALHRVADLDPHAGARRHPRHRHQPSRPQPVHGRRQDRARDRGAGPADASTSRTS